MQFVICKFFNSSWMVTQKSHLRLLLLEFISLVKRMAKNKHSRISKMEVFTKLPSTTGLKNYNQAKRDQSKRCNHNV